MASRELTQSEIRDQLAFEAWLNRRDIVLALKIARSKNKMIREISSLYPVLLDAQFSLPLLKHQEELRILLEDAYRVAILRAGKQTYSSLKSLLEKKADLRSYWESLIAKWSELYALSKANSIGETTMSDVRNAINKGITEGLGTEQIARNIRKVTLLSPWRAATVARTETHGAALYAQEETAKLAEREYGVKLLKFWRPTLDGRTRDAHAAMKGSAGVELSQPFMVGGERLMRPGDPNGSASNVINCRCSLIHRELEIDWE